jgi:hypothetical protein
MPDGKRHLEFISHFPQRLYGACSVARILHDLKYQLDGEPSPDNYKFVVGQLQQILEMPGFLKGQWQYGEFIRETYLQPALLAAQLISSHKELTEDNLNLFGPCSEDLIEEHPECVSREEMIAFQLKCQISHGLNCLSFFYEETNYSLKNISWQSDKLHDF